MLFTTIKAIDDNSFRGKNYTNNIKRFKENIINEHVKSFQLKNINFPIDTSNLLVIDIGVTYLKIIIIAYPAVGISVICSRVCQALGQGIPLLITTITRVILLTAPMSYYFYLIGKPIEWVWYSQVFAILIAAAISYFWMRFYFVKFNIVRSQLKS